MKPPAREERRCISSNQGKERCRNKIRHKNEKRLEQKERKDREGGVEHLL